jgi:hypothetical protein|tara:strand:- start:522 stop:1013 length:492 start_codon:yes stop_codon:yes gene_type:complete
MSQENLEQFMNQVADSEETQARIGEGGACLPKPIFLLKGLLACSAFIFIVSCGGGSSSSGSGECLPNIAGSLWTGTKTYTSGTGTVLAFTIAFNAGGTGTETGSIESSITWSATDSNVTWRKNIEDAYIVNHGTVNCDTLTGTFQHFFDDDTLYSTGTLSFSR